MSVAIELREEAELGDADARLAGEALARILDHLGAGERSVRVDRETFTLTTAVSRSLSGGKLRHSVSSVRVRAREWSTAGPGAVPVPPAAPFTVACVLYVGPPVPLALVTPPAYVVPVPLTKPPVRSTGSFGSGAAVITAAACAGCGAGEGASLFSALTGAAAGAGSGGGGSSFGGSGTGSGGFGMSRS